MGPYDSHWRLHVHWKLFVRTRAKTASRSRSLKYEKIVTRGPRHRGNRILAQKTDYICKECEKFHVVPSLARECEEKHEKERRKSIKAA